MAKIHDSDLPVLKAFLRREAQDFSKWKGKEDQFADFRIGKIQEAIADRSCGMVRVIRLGNTGCQVGALELDVLELNGGWEKLNVYLCSCGNDSCWGNAEAIK